MDRSIYNQLLAWKNREGRKPLILNGARQVGKTYVLQQFGKNEYQKLAFFSLDRNAKAVEVFEKGGSTADMLMALSAISQTDITPNDTLVVLDEIQDWRARCWGCHSTAACRIRWARWRNCASTR